METLIVWTVAVVAIQVAAFLSHRSEQKRHWRDAASACQLEGVEESRWLAGSAVRGHRGGLRVRLSGYSHAMLVGDANYEIGTGTEIVIEPDHPFGVSIHREDAGKELEKR